MTGMVNPLSSLGPIPGASASVMSACLRAQLPCGPCRTQKKPLQLHVCSQNALSTSKVPRVPSPTAGSVPSSTMTGQLGKPGIGASRHLPLRLGQPVRLGVHNPRSRSNHSVQLPSCWRALVSSSPGHPPMSVVSGPVLACDWHDRPEDRYGYPEGNVLIAAWIAAATATVVALISASLTYNTARRLSRISDQVTHVNRQLSELYGPLLALSSASAVSWREFRKKYGASREMFFSDSTQPSQQEIDTWQYWIKYVFMPINRRMLDVILEKTDLIEGDEIPESFSIFLAHVTGYEATLAQWADGDVSHLGSVNDYPGDSFNKNIESNYRDLKQRRQALLGDFPKTEGQGLDSKIKTIFRLRTGGHAR